MIDTREELIVALNEASEIEHGLMIQYLFAALTCRKTVAEGLTPEQEALVRAWEGGILRVAVDEMGHLGTVANMLSAIGAPPHFRRPNFPQATGYYPFRFDLIPFGEEALYRFQIFELPRGAEPPPPPLDDDAQSRALRANLVPDPLDYRYVGELYERIGEGFALIPERDLFVGRRDAQADNEWSVQVDLRSVIDRGSALAAIKDIIEDGEGSPANSSRSHYTRFTTIRRALVQAGRFAAGRDVAPNPRIRAQRDSPGTYSLITHKPSVQTAELFATAYALVLRMLAQFFAFSGETVAQRQTLRDCASRMMSVALRPISEVLTTLPLSDPQGPRAGPTFELFNEVIVSPYVEARWTLLLEHFDALIEGARDLAAVDPRLGHIGETVSYVRRTLAAVAKEGGHA